MVIDESLLPVITRMPSRHVILDAIISGTLLGAVVLGVGGRLAMAGITAVGGGTPQFSFGGTMTVVALGAVSGLAGSVLALLSKLAVSRAPSRFAWTEYVLFGALLFVVTLRGLRGTPSIGSWFFYPLVGVYGFLMSLRLSRGSIRASAPPN
jgi:hypothetical protein